MSRIAILNSRQPLRPTADTHWVAATLRAVTELGQRGDTSFLCSVGTTPHELTLAALARQLSTIDIIAHSSHVTTLCDDRNNLTSALAREFNLDSASSQFTCVAFDTTKSDPDHARDQMILNYADEIYPISIRPGGVCERLLALPEIFPKVNDCYRTPYERRRSPIRIDYSSRPLSNAASQLQNYLIHWTRSSNGPWPGETRAEYYEDIFRSGGSYPRHATHTLSRILSEKRLRASGRHQLAGSLSVSLTAANISQSVELMRYRARYREMSLEPYGLAIPREVAEDIGILPVLYVSKIGNIELRSSKPGLYHSVGKMANWPLEQEWRHVGDLELAPLWPKLIALVEFPEQAQFIRNTFKIECIGVFER